MAWTRKDFYGQWDFEAGDEPDVPRAGGGIGARDSRQGWTVTATSIQETEDRHLAKLIENDAEARRRLLEHIVGTAIEELDGGGSLAPEIEEGLRRAAADDPRDTRLRALVDRLDRSSSDAGDAGAPTRRA